MFQGKRNIFIPQRGLLTEGVFPTTGTPSAPSGNVPDQPTTHNAPQSGAGGALSPEPPLVQPSREMDSVERCHLGDTGHPSPRKRLRFADASEATTVDRYRMNVSSSHTVRAPTPMHVRTAMLRSFLVAYMRGQAFATSTTPTAWVVFVDDVNMPPAVGSGMTAHSSRSSPSAASAVIKFADEVRRSLACSVVASEGSAKTVAVSHVDYKVWDGCPPGNVALLTDRLEAYLRESLLCTTASHDDDASCEQQDTMWLISGISTASEAHILRCAIRRVVQSQGRGQAKACSDSHQPLGAVVLRMDSSAQSIKKRSLSAAATAVVEGGLKSRRHGDSGLDLLRGSAPMALFDKIVVVPMLL